MTSSPVVLYRKRGWSGDTPKSDLAVWELALAIEVLSKLLVLDADTRGATEISAMAGSMRFLNLAQVHTCIEVVFSTLPAPAPLNSLPPSYCAAAESGVSPEI